MSLAGAIRAGRAFVAIGADDAELQQALQRLRGRLQRFGQSLAAVGGGLLAASSGIAAALAWPVTLAARLEMVNAAFTTMLKDAGAAQDLLAELQQFAAETPFEFPELADAARLLLAFGGSADTVVDELRVLGDIASGIGAPLGEIAEIYGKIRTDGRVMGEDLNQLGGRGIPIISELAKRFGVAESAIRGMASEGKIGFADVEAAFKSMASGTGIFAGGMERASRTLLGLWSTMKDNIAQAVLPIGQALLPALGQAVGQLTTFSQLVGRIVDRNRERAVTAASVAAALAAAGALLVGGGTTLAILTIAAGGLASAFTLVTGIAGSLVGVVASLAGPIAAIAVALTAAHAAGVNFGTMWSTVIGGLGDVFAPLVSYAQQFTGEIAAGFVDASTTAQAAWASVVSAISRGDAAAAMEIVTAGLQVAWLQATAGIRNAWQSVTTGIRNAWTDAITFIGKMGATAWTNLQNIFATLGTYITGTLDLVGTKARQLAALLAGLWTEGGREAAQGTINELQRQFQERAGQRSQQLLDTLDRNDDFAADWFNTLDQQAEEEKRRRSQGGDALLDAARQRLENAQRGLDSLLEQEQREATIDREKRDAQQKTAADAAAKAGGLASSGAFSAAAAQRLGTTRLAERTAKAAEATAKNTEIIAQRDPQNLVFS